jgi:class 3 adenylate cyclase
MERAAPGQVLVSSTVRDLVAGSGIAFSDHEPEPLRVEGAPGEWRVSAVVP